MNYVAKDIMTKAENRLSEAVNSNTAGKHAEALTLAYKACYCIAVAYLLAVTGKQYPEDDNTYELFNKTIYELNRHPAFIQQIREIAGDVYVLRETYQPALLDETTSDDAEQMIDRVTALHVLVNQIIRYR